MEKDMSQECTKIAEDGHKRAPNLTTHWSIAFIRQSSKNDKENYQEHFSYTCRTSIFSLFFTVFYARYEKDHEPKSNRREKAAKGYVPRMHQDRRRLAQTCPKFDHPLEQACISNKNEKRNCQNQLSYTCRTSFFMVHNSVYSALHNWGTFVPIFGDLATFLGHILFHIGAFHPMLGLS